jgi:hypothetical protein
LGLSHSAASAQRSRCCNATLVARREWLQSSDFVQLGGVDQRSQAGPAFVATRPTGEQCIAAPESNRPDGSLHNVVVDLDAAVGQEHAQSVPLVEGVVDRLGERRLGGDLREAIRQPRLEIIEQRSGLGLADCSAIVGRAVADAGFDVVDLCQPAQRRPETAQADLLYASKNFRRACARQNASVIALPARRGATSAA